MMDLNVLLIWSDGNPGVLVFLSTVFNSGSGIIINKLKECKKIRGAALYVLYNDLCDRQISRVERLCKYCPNDILENACLRQDWSGRALVEKYFKLTFDEWFNLFEDEINIELWESGADRELDFNPEKEFEKRYEKYLNQ
jgi:hypothetical protein